MKRLTYEQLSIAARRLAAPIANVMAVVEVESGGGWFVDLRAGLLESDGRGGGFLADGRVKILYEPHVFWRRTGGRYGETYPISARSWGTHPYGTLSEQWRRLETASELDPAAAIEACSWGLFQVLGENWRALHYESAAAFRQAMELDEGAHLESFARFVEANRLVPALRAGGDTPESWVAFARPYNGPGYASHDYHGRLARARAPYAAAGATLDEARWRALLERGVALRRTWETSP